MKTLSRAKIFSLMFFELVSCIGNIMWGEWRLKTRI